MAEIEILKVWIISEGIIVNLIQSVESKIDVRQTREIPKIEKCDFLNYFYLINWKK